LIHKYQTPDFARDRPRTRIVATIGPATGTVDRIKALIRAGMSVARLNLAHGTMDQHRGYLRAVRQAATELNVAIGVLVDLPGPKYRTGTAPGQGIRLARGAKFTLASSDVPATLDRISVMPPGLHRDVRRGSQLLIDDGAIQMRVVEVAGTDVRCVVTVAGLLKTRKGVATPRRVNTLGYLTVETRAALDFVGKEDVDFVGLSYIRSEDDILLVRGELKKAGRIPQLIAKIELGQAVKNLNAIMRVVDGVMVARGDLGVELPIQLVPHAQKEIILAANRAGKVVITATQMLESMADAPTPTRAEATDVHNAVLDGSDAVMLSRETSTGKYPVQAVRYMARIARQAEKSMDFEALQRRRYDALLSEKRAAVDDAIAYSACQAAVTLHARVIVAFTESGSTAARVASFRPPVPVLALVRDPEAGQKLALRWGVLPIQAPKLLDIASMFYEGSQAALTTGHAAEGDLAVAVMGVPIGVPGNTNLLRVMYLPEPKPT